MPFFSVLNPIPEETIIIEAINEDVASAVARARFEQFLHENGEDWADYPEVDQAMPVQRFRNRRTNSGSEHILEDGKVGEIVLITEIHQGTNPLKFA